MQRIKFIADTASDIPDRELLHYHIDMPSVPITIDGKSYFERKSFGIEEFYNVLDKTTEIPATSRVPADDYLECYKRAYAAGYTDIVNVTINSAGSGTNASAHMAVEMLHTEMPETKEKLRIHIVDSRTYSAAYGYPVVEAAKKANAGAGVDEIIDYLEDWFACAEIYLGCYSLEYAKKSGRINAAAAFVGDVLGLRPIISMIDGETKIIDKVRGEKNVVGRIVEAYRQNCVDSGETAVVICGGIKQYGKDLQGLMEKETGRKLPVYTAGASIVINAGPKIVALVCKGKKRR